MRFTPAGFGCFAASETACAITITFTFTDTIRLRLLVGSKERSKDSLIVFDIGENVACGMRSLVGNEGGSHESNRPPKTQRIAQQDINSLILDTCRG